MTLNTQVQADHHAPPITRILAEFAVNHPSRGWDAAVDHEAHRTFANWVGCALGAARHETVESALSAVMLLDPSPQSCVIGRSERVDMASAALINGISSHTFDFDDTHLKTIIHPAGPVASAAYALADFYEMSRRQVLDAMTLGIEVSCRVGNCIYPDHYDRGWHITGSTGMLGAAAACARLLGLNVDQTQMALGIAASQPVGVREQFGTMTKPFHPGAAAKAGLMSALLASRGFTASQRALEAPRGLIQTYSDKSDWREITEGLGERWEAGLNTYKPFACGIVAHPSIDGCAQLRRDHGFVGSEIERVTLRVHPLVLELMGKKTPRIGLEGKFSVFHAAAVGLLFGKAGIREFSDEIVQNPEVIALRDRVVAISDPSMREESADVTVELKSGVSHHVFVRHAVGSLEVPMSDDQLRQKFIDQAGPVLGLEAAEREWEGLITPCAAA